MKIIPAILLLVISSGCKFSSGNYNYPVGDWIRSDDYGEYRGIYVYSLAENGTMYFTDFSDKEPREKENRVEFGSWKESNGILKWFKKDGVCITSYRPGNDGKYWEIDGNYYVPVSLERIKLIDGIPKIIKTPNQKITK